MSDAEIEQAMKEAGKSLEKNNKKQLKKDCGALQKAVSKCRVEKITQEELEHMKQAKEQLADSAYHILNITDV